MVKITQGEDPTIIAMKKAIEAAYVDEGRDYLGASYVGRPCAREVWYQYNRYPRKPFDAQSLMRFDDGHRTEDLTAARLRMIDGVQLWTHDDNGKQYGFSAFDGRFKGHVDGVILGLKQAPKTPHVWENKACEDKKYNAFKKAKQTYGEKQALKNWDENYFVQAQVCMHYLQLDRHYLTVSSAGGRDYDSCRTEYDPATASQYIDRAEKIIDADTEPERISEKPDFYMCKWCDFRETCHAKP